MTQDAGRLQLRLFRRVRRTGPSSPRRKGAAAIVIRSIGTDSHRFPHTGVQKLGSAGVRRSRRRRCPIPMPSSSSGC
jgi:hypothetical protein